MIVYVSIGNSDDKLTQREWALYWSEVHQVVEGAGSLHGVWTSASVADFQNACWCVEIDDPELLYSARRQLGKLARRFGQESIAFAPAERTDFLRSEP